MPRLEDLYEVPPTEIEMTGGYYDGRRIPLTDDRDTWLLPIPAPVTFDPEPDVTRPTMDIQRYRWTGSIKDDGTRVFKAG